MKALLKIMVVGLSAAVFSALPAHAVIITLGATTYDVVAYTPGTSADSIIGLLDDQPWWNDFTSAHSAADQVKAQLGAFYDVPDGWGPFFAYAPTSGGWYAGEFWQGDMNQASGVGFSGSYTGFTFAIATAVPTPDGGVTAMLLGTASLGVFALRRKFAHR